jgi:hypothetical protein
MDLAHTRKARHMHIRRFAATSMLVAALSLAGAAPALATNSSECTFEKGTTTCTEVHGSHGEFDTHHGNVGSSGSDTGGGECKVTGPDHTC